MLLRLIYDDRLAQGAYLIGCQKTGEAIIIDPQRDVDRYIDAAKKEGLKIIAVAETHIHADFLSGARELAERTGARVYVSGEGGPDWTYQWLDKRAGGGSYNHQAVKDGDTFRVGNIEFRVMHTPGHTPEHVCYIVTDKGGGAAEPMGILSGDFVFVGDLGRPDLLETAAGVAGTAAGGAKQLFESVQKFLKLPDYLQVWPAHGAGSACGKALGAVPQTTVGYEKRFNPAIGAAKSQGGFVDFILSGQPEPPMYFARMKRDNKAGPPVLGGVPRPRALGAAELKGLDGQKVAIIDTRPWAAFRVGHIPGSLFAPLDGMFTNVTGSFVREDEEIYLVIEPARADEAVRALIRIGLDKVQGTFDPSVLADYERAGARLATAPEVNVAEGKVRIGAETFVLDVRGAGEFAEGHIPGALNVAYTRLASRLGDVPRDKRILVNCRSGARSARAVVYLRRAGYDATNLAGGFLAWEQAAEEIAT